VPERALLSADSPAREERPAHVFRQMAEEPIGCRAFVVRKEEGQELLRARHARVLVGPSRGFEGQTQLREGSLEIVARIHVWKNEAISSRAHLEWPRRVIRSIPGPSDRGRIVRNAR